MKLGLSGCKLAMFPFANVGMWVRVCVCVFYYRLLTSCLNLCEPRGRKNYVGQQYFPCSHNFIHICSIFKCLSPPSPPPPSQVAIVRMFQHDFGLSHWSPSFKRINFVFLNVCLFGEKNPIWLNWNVSILLGSAFGCTTGWMNGWMVGVVCGLLQQILE